MANADLFARVRRVVHKRLRQNSAVEIYHLAGQTIHAVHVLGAFGFTVRDQARLAEQLKNDFPEVAAAITMDRLSPSSTVQDVVDLIARRLSS